jgi:sRNA-binding regulator protein Hfq
MNRKLIRPNLSEFKDKPAREREASKKKPQPSYETHAENYYYLKQMNKKTRMSIVFIDGSIIEGTIEWYDRDCIKLNRDLEPNLLIYKHNIKYLYKMESDNSSPAKGPSPKPKTSRQG